MLVQLAISNFAIIQQLETRFSPGLNILSGETGAGKSIIISAVNLLLGGRASSDLIRTGAEEAVVEALFRMPEASHLRDLLSGMGIPGNGELLIKRTISREGRNKIFINGSMATLQMLSGIGPFLISISGQHEHQRLLKPESHLDLMDDYAGLFPERQAFRESYDRLNALETQRRQLDQEIRIQEERRDLNRFQMEEIEKARIAPAEDSALDQERDRLRHAEEIREAVSSSYQTLYEREDALFSVLSHCIKTIEGAARHDRRLNNLAETLLSARALVEDAGLELRNFLSTIHHDPRRLEAVEERLQLLGRLKRKYGGTLEAVIRYGESLKKTRNTLEEKKHKREEIGEKIRDQEKQVLSKAFDLSVKRRQAAKNLENAVENELKLLDMGDTRFQARFQPDEKALDDDPTALMPQLREDGLDTVEFMLSPNVGEALRPLVKIASGGELSRIMLALKTILARTSSVETIIFDEVDAGIGGATAETVGDKLNALIRFHQIICITHLPQIASKGATHFKVQKFVRTGRTEAMISKLGPEERIQEIARLLGGKAVTRQAIAHAKEMLK